MNATYVFVLRFLRRGRGSDILAGRTTGTARLGGGVTRPRGPGDLAKG